MEEFDADSLARITQLIADVFNVELAEITINLAFGDLPQWDSMGHMDLLASLEEHFSIEINAQTITELTSVSTIYKAIFK